MIFPHELGHFIAAKRMGVKVNEFAFGMGPTIWKKQRGETLHSIRPVSYTHLVAPGQGHGRVLRDSYSAEESGQYRRA